MGVVVYGRGGGVRRWQRLGGGGDKGRPGLQVRLKPVRPAGGGATSCFEVELFLLVELLPVCVCVSVCVCVYLDAAQFVLTFAEETTIVKRRPVAVATHQI